MTLLAMQAAGVDGAAVLAAMGTPAERVHSPDFAYPHESQADFWELAERLSNDPDVGLRVGLHMPSYQGEVLGYLFMSSPDFGTGLSRLVAYDRLLSDATSSRLGEDAAGAYIASASQSPRMNACRHHVECYTLGLLRFFREMTDGAFAPRRIHFTCAPPADLARRSMAFGCPVVYGRSENLIYFAPALLALSSRHAESELFQLHDRVAADRLHKVTARGFVRRFQRALDGLLEFGEVTLEAVAKRLQLSPSEVREQLAAAGTQFSTELDDYRRRLACKLLAGSDYSVRDICYLVGFSEPPTFYRAFRRWESDTPVAYRCRHRDAAAPRLGDWPPSAQPAHGGQ